MSGHSQGEQDFPRGNPVVTAVMVDAAFFLKRLQSFFGMQYGAGDAETQGEKAAEILHDLAEAHIFCFRAGLYRIFVYDAPPSSWKGHTAIEKKSHELSKSLAAQFRNAFHQKLLRMRKVALRLGYIPSTQVHWQIKPDILKELLQKKRKWEELTDDDFCLDLRQKGVDMRLGMDIASLAYKRLVNQIVLISGDADFVPAAKIARREGIDFIVNPLGLNVREDLAEHADMILSGLSPRNDHAAQCVEEPEKTGDAQRVEEPVRQDQTV